MRNSLVWLATKVATLALLIGICTSCGNQTNFGWGIEDDLWFNDVYLEDGDRRGNYIYYRGDWHYRGFGTPYYWNYY